MKLHSLRVNQFGKFSSPTGIGNLAEGMNVLVAPNEAGKSTLVRALKMAMFEKHGLTGADVQRIQNTGSKGAPVVEVVFELEDGLYTLRKRFIVKPYAKLTLPGGSTLEGEAAEAHLRDLLAFEKPAKGAIKSKDLGLWSVLWVEQGDALQDLEVPKLGQASVREALESTVGAVLGGPEGRQLVEVVRSQLDSMVTGAKRSPKGKYKQALERQQELTTKLDDLRTRHDVLESNLESLESVKQQIRDIEEGGQESELKEKLVIAHAKKSDLATLEAEIRAEESALELHQQHRSQALDAIDERQALAASLTTATENLKRVEKELTGVNEEESRLKGLIAAAKTERDASRKRKSLLQVALKEKSMSLRGAELKSAVGVLAGRIAVAEQLAADVSRLRLEISENFATDERLEVVTNAYAQVEAHQVAMSAAATLITFDLDPKSLGRVTFDDGGSPDSGETVELIDATRIAIEGVGDFTVNPQVGDADTRRVRLDDASKALNDALANVRAIDLKQAREHAKTRRKLVGDCEAKQRELNELLQHYEGGLSQLNEEHIDKTNELSDVASELNGDVPDDVLGAAVSRDNADEELQVAVLEELNAQTAMDAHLEMLDSHRVEWQEQKESLVGLKSEVKRLAAELAQAPPADVLAADLQECNQAVEGYTASVQALVEKAGGETTETLSQRIERFDKSLENLQTRLRSLNDSRIKAEAVLQNEGGAGIGEEMEKTERNLDLAQTAATLAQRDADVLSLLADTLAEAEQEMNDRFMGPIVEKITPYLRMLFSNVSISLDESLSVRTFDRDGVDAPDFEALSRGTQEQINILTRIAIAELMAEQGIPAMVVLDDAFAWSDDQRLDRLFDALTMASKNVQILLLSCRDSSFASAGGTVVEIKDVEEGDLQSA